MYSTDFGATFPREGEGFGGERESVGNDPPRGSGPTVHSPTFGSQTQNHSSTLRHIHSEPSLVIVTIILPDCLWVAFLSLLSW